MAFFVNPGRTAKRALPLAEQRSFSNYQNRSVVAAGTAHDADDIQEDVDQDGEGRLTSCIIDALQTAITVDGTGAITTDLTAPVLTKNQLGDDYDMRKASSIGKEWNEQAAAFAAYCSGMTADEISGIAIKDGKAEDADLLAGCTLYPGSFQAIVVKALG